MVKILNPITKNGLLLILGIIAQPCIALVAFDTNTTKSIQTNLSYNIEPIEKKFVIGISIETSNEMFQKDVPPFWNRFFNEDIATKIPNVISYNLFAIYTNYQGDFTKPFTYLIGCEVTNLDSIPEGMMGVEIPYSSYAVYNVNGEFPKSMINAWHTIWNSDLNRSYTTDFEIYPSDFNPKDKPEIKIHIGIN